MLKCHDFPSLFLKALMNSFFTIPFKTSTTRMGRETMVYEYGLRVVQFVKCIRETWGVYTSPRLVRHVRVVKQWYTSRTTRTGCETMVYESYSL